MTTRRQDVGRRSDSRLLGAAKPSRTAPLPAGWTRRIARGLPKGIRGRLFLLISLTLLPVLMLQAWIDYRQHLARRQQASQTELEVAQGVAINFATYIDGVRRQLETTGEAIRAFTPDTAAKADRLLTTAAAQGPAIRSVSWVSPDGTVLASSLSQGVGLNVSSRPYFQQITAGRLWALGDMTPHGVIVKDPAVAMGVAIRDSNNALQGIVVVSFEPTRLDEMSFAQQRYAGGMYAIFDGQGQMVFHSPSLPLTWDQRVQMKGHPLLHQALDGEIARGEIMSTLTGEQCFAAYVPIPTIGWVAAAARPTRIVLAPVHRGLAWDSALAVLAVTLAFLFATLLARTIAGPLSRLEREARSMGESKIERPPDALAPTEVSSLRNTLAQMTADLVDRAEALRQSERRYRKLFEANLAGVYVTRLDGTILDVNEAMITMLGYSSREEVLQHRAPDFYVDPAFRARMIELLRRDGIVPGQEAVLLRKDGSLIHAIGHAVLLTNDQTGEPYIQGVAVDISARKQAEDALRDLTGALETQVARRTRQLELRTRQLQKLAMDLSDTEERERRHLAELLHDDLQQVLAAAKFHLNVLSNRIRNNPSQYAVVGQVDHMLTEAIQKSRNLSHEISPSVLYQGTLAQALTWLAEQQQAKHGLRVHLDVRGEVNPQSDAVKTFFYKAAQELLFNVVKHAGIKVAQIRLRRMGLYVCLTVSDHGRGFDPQAVRDATGFGLFSLRERSEALGGRMKIRSAEDKGSRFFIAIPERPDAKAG